VKKIKRVCEKDQIPGRVFYTFNCHRCVYSSFMQACFFYLFLLFFKKKYHGLVVLDKNMWYRSATSCFFLCLFY
jgi:hypothetical protein